ncbi:DUF3006 domain-containing protein [Solibaculum mannosilyticum]|uniref:DUF3006 domain-containing protein n=1 Tax=Solibaculum mannosilyticum TaxID=2780922 RepID=A0A7I8D073_9FIRM|nr:DUF3006 domain-containing protein [Solibaculum mannosilyticum]BCI60171.1 hypothetical protein C12CBH8_08100 [Solibaculum mannosilyticum]
MDLLIVDRIEENTAVCEDEQGNMQSIPLSQLPAGVKEGDCLVRKEDGYLIDRQLTQRRRQEILDLQNSLWN